MAQRWNQGTVAMVGWGLLSMLGSTNSAWACPPPAPPAELGAPSPAGVAPPSVQVKRDFSQAGPLDLATDGFFVLETWGFDATRLATTTSVTVTTAQGLAVPGSLRVFQGASGSYVGWQADAPIRIGTQLHLSVAGATFDSSFVVPDEVDAVVTGEPVMFTAGELRFDSWLDYRQGSAERVACGGENVPCGGAVTAPLLEHARQAAQSSWSVEGAFSGFALWEVTVTPEAPAEGVPLPQAQLVIDPSDALQTGMLVFAEAKPQQCATVAVKDLRSGESATGRHCEAPAEPSETYRDFSLDGCSEPPSTELTPLWCELVANLDSPICNGAPLDDPMPNRPTPNDADADSSRVDHTSTSCQMAVVGASAAGGAFAGFGAMVGALALATRRKRARN